MLILGLNIGHDPSAVIINSQGEVLSAIHEARITRNKKERSFPFKSILYVLESSEVSPDEISHVAYSNYEEDHLSSVRDKYLCGMASLDLDVNELILHSIKSIGITKASINKVNHHFSHACAAHFSSNSESTLIVTCDGFGDNESLTIRRPLCEVVPEIPLISHGITSSLGLLYQYVTGALGYSMLAEEWKLLGLENKGNPSKVSSIFDDLLIIDNQEVSWNLQKLKNWLPSELDKYDDMLVARALRLYLEYSCKQYKIEDVAAGVQNLVESTILGIISNSLRTSGDKVS